MWKVTLYLEDEGGAERPPFTVLARYADSDELGSTPVRERQRFREVLITVPPTWQLKRAECERA